MPRNISWDSEAWEEYLYWQSHDRKILHKINGIIKELARDSFFGTGKPEPLRGNLSGMWSRRIDAEHRIVYVVKNEDVLIFSCRGHYDD